MAGGAGTGEPTAAGGKPRSQEGLSAAGSDCGVQPLRVDWLMM